MKSLLFKYSLFAIISLSMLSCGSVLFHGDEKMVANPGFFNFSYEEKIIPVKQDANLRAWLIKSENAKRLLIQFHGNSENRSGHFLQFAWLTRFHTDVLIVDYRGFGDSSGISGDREMKEDVKRVLEYAKTELPNYQETVVAGQSLGGHYLVEALKTDKKVYDLLILDGTFLEFPSLAVKKFFPRISLFLNDDKVILPVKKTLIVHGVKDPVIPVELGYHLERVIEGIKVAWFPADGKHLDTFYAHNLIYREKLLQLLGEGPWTPLAHNYSDKEKILLKEKYCGLSENYKKIHKETLNWFKSNQSQIHAPADCQATCLCTFYADLFKSFGSRRLAQSMYRQNSLSDESREEMCKAKAEEWCRN